MLLTIALGVGATTAIFSVGNGVLIRPLAFPDEHRVVELSHRSPYWLASAPELADYKEHVRAFQSLAAYTQGEVTVATSGDPERLVSATVGAEFFSVLGVAPAIGRTFVPDDDLAPGMRGNI